MIAQLVKQLLHRSAEPSSHQQPPCKTPEAMVCTNNSNVGEAGTR